MAKLTRESRLRERRLDKQARKNARKYAAAHPEEAGDIFTGSTDPSAASGESDPSDRAETEPATTEALA